MKVKELIEVLKNLDQEKTVMVRQIGDSGLKVDSVVDVVEEVFHTRTYSKLIPALDQEIEFEETFLKTTESDGFEAYLIF